MILPIHKVAALTLLAAAIEWRDARNAAIAAPSLEAYNQLANAEAALSRCVPKEAP